MLFNLGSMRKLKKNQTLSIDDIINAVDSPETAKRKPCTRTNNVAILGSTCVGKTTVAKLLGVSAYQKELRERKQAKMNPEVLEAMTGQHSFMTADDDEDEHHPGLSEPYTCTVATHHSKQKTCDSHTVEAFDTDKCLRKDCPLVYPELLKCNAFILVFSTADRASFKEIERTYADIRLNAQRKRTGASLKKSIIPPPVMIVANHTEQRLQPADNPHNHSYLNVDEQGRPRDMMDNTADNMHIVYSRISAMDNAQLIEIDLVKEAEAGQKLKKMLGQLVGRLYQK